MRGEFKKGYTLYRNDSNPELIFIVPHSGPALEITTSRDDHSETVSSLCWKDMGGTLLISNISRRREWGIDFNRDIPSLNLALKYHPYFTTKKNQELMHKYSKKYAWVARNEQDYYERLSIYQNFWAEVKDQKYIILIHKNFPKMKAVPSIMDIITFSQKGIRKELLNSILDDLNSKYSSFFSKIHEDYKQAILFEMKRTVLSILRIYETFNLIKMGPASKENLIKDLRKIALYADKIALNRLKKSFTPQNFLAAVENALENSPLPRITIEQVHDGSLALAPYNKLFPKKDKTIIEIESSGFLNYWHPSMASKIVKDLTKSLMSKTD